MKIQLRSSQKNLRLHNDSKNKLRISKSPTSILSSPRIALFRKQKIVKTMKNLKKHPQLQLLQKQIFIFTESNNFLMQLSLFPLRFQLTPYDIDSPPTKQKEILILTKIQEFYDLYNQYFSTLAQNFSSLRWIIVSNAINNKQTQEEFNLEYEPIQFVFLKNIGEIVNSINLKNMNFSSQKKKLSFFKTIINFAVYDNQYALIEQKNFDTKVHEMIAGASSSYQPQLWLLSQRQLQKIKNYKLNFYIITQSSISDGLIDLIICPGQKSIYIIYENHDYILSSLQIKELQQKLTQQDLKRLFYRSNNQQNKSKIIEKYFKRHMIFNLIDFPQAISQKYREIQQSLVLFNQSKEFTYSKCNVFNIYYGQKDKGNIFGYEFSKNDETLQKNILNIKNFYLRIMQLKLIYLQIKLYMDEYFIFLYDLVEIQEVSKQMQYLSSKRPLIIENLECLNSFMNKKVILISSQLNNRINLIHELQKIYIIQLDPKQLDKTLVHQKLVKYIKDQIKQQNQLNKNTQIRKAVNFCPSLSLYLDLEVLEIAHKSFSTQKIQNFKIVLKSLQRYSKYIIILAMDQYNQQKQTLLKQIQKHESILFQVYLQYGNQFIQRGINNKYSFYKKQQIVQKIKSIDPKNHNQAGQYLFNSWQNSPKKFSDITHNHIYSPKNTFSTPNIMNTYEEDKYILICLPKGTPLHSLMNRSEKPYSILIYKNLQQIRQLVKYLTSQFHLIIINSSEKSIIDTSFSSMKTISSSPRSFKTNYEEIQIKDLTLKKLHHQIDRIIDQYNLIKTQKQLQKINKELPVVVLYDDKKEKHLQSIDKFNKIFKNSKIIFMTKKEYKNITSNYKIIQISLYQIGGKNQFQSSTGKRINNLVDLFKLQMSPTIPFHIYQQQRIFFSLKNFFVKRYLQYEKDRKIKGSNSKSLSKLQQNKLRNKSIIQKQYILNQPGFIITQSSDLNIFNKKQKFENCNQLIQILVRHNKIGNQICIIISQNIFLEVKHYINIYNRQFVWIVIVQDFKKCIIKEPNLIFIQQNRVQKTTIKVVDEYRRFKNQALTLLRDKIQISKQESELKIIFGGENDIGHNLQILYSQKILNQFDIKNLKNTLLFRNRQNLNQILAFLKQSLHHQIITQKFLDKNKQIESKQIKNDGQSTNSVDNSYSISENNEKQIIYITTNIINKRFIEQTLKIIQQTQCMLIIYDNIEEVIDYSQLEKNIFVIEKEENIDLKDSLIVRNNETPFQFAHRLKNFIKAIRQS